MALIFAIVVAALLVASLPRWRHSSNWGYAPSGALGFLLAVLLVLMATGSISHSL